jgi:AbrB family looped-hinge helix DNA binding protein
MTARTSLSAKGQVVIPKDVRDALGYKPGQGFDVIKTDGGILLRPLARKSGRTTDEIIAEIRTLYQHEGPPVTIAEMNAAVDAMFAAKGADMNQDDS